MHPRIFSVINDVNFSPVTQLMKTGFSYVRIPPHVHIENELQALHQSGLDFFHRKAEYKKQWAVNEKKMEGYIDREEGKIPQSIKQCFFRPLEPISHFQKDSKYIEAVYKVFHDGIALPLLSRIFSELGLGQYYPEISKKTFPSFSFSYYPEKTKTPCAEALKVHKDFDMITALHINKPGLEMLCEDGTWYKVDPIPGHIVVNLGNTLEIMTHKKTTSVSHRVRVLPEERLSIGVFVGPGGPIKDYTFNRVMHESYNAYLITQFNQLYEESQPPKPQLASTSKSSLLRRNSIFANQERAASQPTSPPPAATPPAPTPLIPRHP